jgi:hypothetical protein
MDKWNMRVSKEGKASVHNLTVFTLNTAILMGGVEACFAMRDAMSGDEFL